MSLADVESGLKQYIQTEGPITLETTDPIEIAGTLGSDAGFGSGAEPMIKLLVEEALHDLSSDGKISVNKDLKEGTTELRYVLGSRTNDIHEGIRPQDILTNDELIQNDNDDVIYYFNRLTTQGELSPEEETIIAQALIHALEKVQKNLDNLI